MTSQNDGNTVFLTEQEVERIQITVKDKLKKCSELRGHARERRDAKTAISQATAASLMADMAGTSDPNIAQTKGRGGTLPVLVVGQPYPPCVVSLQDLEPMKLADLLMDTHHRGRQLTVKRASPVVTLAARSWTMVQDKVGEEIERLEVCLHTSRQGEDVLQSASVFVIKEPYFTLTDQGEATLRIDHPSDLIACWNEIANSGEVAAEKVARSFKVDGDTLLKQNDLPIAHAKYTESLKAARQEIVSNANPDLARDISRSRTHVNFLLDQVDEAKADAEASLTSRQDQRSKELDSKAYFSAGCAAYKLGEYQDAKDSFEKQLKLVPGDKDANTKLRKIEMRLREQEIGTYDVTKIRAGLSRARPRVDAASFIKMTKLGDSPGRGRGLFAMHNVSPRDIIMCEKAFCVVWGHEREAWTAMTYDVRDDRIRVSPVGLSKSIVHKLLNNPSQLRKVIDLYGDYQGDGESVFMTEEGPVVDTFRIHDIMSRNAFDAGKQYEEEGSSNASTGLWVWTSYINHSCIPNAKREYIGDLMLLRATRPILAGEEVFITYDESSDYDARKTALMNTWGFECNCALCTAERSDDPAARKKRQELATDADAFLEREHWANAKRLTIVRAQRLAQAIDDTYDEERYKGLPRVATQRIKDWLAKASPRR
ncbi:tetratricopeptide [Rhizodiscina lignyota]|uniref:Tetratricopeptide n=1 Tax=Rhizodiscina lignyota TaxID=1504668 RepID=A0A9P4IK99_9PEZI|nr:tetratricopeptide [Rhizodiscina lignyota]